ncbi:hypothetical protein CTAYLR_000116 [Chrysophaeum taylorii]|uniref:acetylornithine transaminase n=1 Tax=Chrysophaeum taylorii TaxID=2483200 RepID=A0AAD7XM79_9STRA|nr:hypothetical protein CTAYLR_000116 [Chrysophaeum taylorii]
MMVITLLLATELAAALQVVPSSEQKRVQFDKVVQSTYGRYPVTISRGKGCVLYDDDADKAYLDFVAGIATCCLGHGDQRLVDAVSNQMRRVHHVSNLYYIPEQGELAEWLVKRTRGASRVFFCNSGGEANEAALKLALKHATLERKIEAPVVLTALGSFHGRTIATISATAQPKYHGPNGCWKIDLFDHFAYNDVADATAAFERHKGKVAAVLVEPVQGEGGVKPGTPDFFAALRRLCDDEGALLMLDEVQAGVGRTGKMWGHDHVLSGDYTADVVTCAKALGGGVPLGAMLCSPKCDVFQPGDHATTYGGNPLACSAGLAVAKAIDDDGLIDNTRDRGDQLLTGLRKIMDAKPHLVADVRGRGLLVGMELHTPSASDLVALCATNGLLLVPAGPAVVRFVPPLVATSLEVDAALSIVEDALGALEASRNSTEQSL